MASQSDSISPRTVSPSYQTKSAPPTFQKKYINTACAVGFLAGIIIAGLSAASVFGPIGSTGFIASAAGGGALILASSILSIWKLSYKDKTPVHLDTSRTLSDNKQSPADVVHPIAHDRASTFPEESLPAINTTMTLTSGIKIKVNQDTILLQEGHDQFGIITSSQKQTRIMAALLEKHQNLLVSLFSEDTPQTALELLAAEIEKELPPDAIVSWCFVNGKEKTYFTRVFGQAKLSIRTPIPWGGLANTKPNDKLKIIWLRVYPLKDCETAGLFLTKKKEERKFVDRVYQDKLPDHHFISLMNLDGNTDIQYPHPDYLNKSTEET